MRGEDRKVIGWRKWSWGDWRSCGKSRVCWNGREPDQGTGEGLWSEANWRRFRANREGWRTERVSMEAERGREGLGLGTGRGGCYGEARTMGMRLRLRLRWKRFGLLFWFGCCRRVFVLGTCGTEPLLKHFSTQIGHVKFWGFRWKMAVTLRAFSSSCCSTWPHTFFAVEFHSPTL